MVTGASTADLAVILVDARRGLTEQSRRHAALAGLLGVPQITVCVNKMDLVGYAEERFDAVVREFLDFAAARGDARTTSDLHPRLRAARRQRGRALGGDALVRRRAAAGPSRGGARRRRRRRRPARLPVQYVIRARRAHGRAATPAGWRRGRCGSATRSSSCPPGPQPDRRPRGTPGPARWPPRPPSITVVLEDDLDVGRGDMIARSGDAPAPVPRPVGDDLLARRLARRGPARATCSSTPPARCARGSMRSRTASTSRPSSAMHRRAGAQRDRPRAPANGGPIYGRPLLGHPGHRAFILIDEATNDTVGAGMVR